MPNDNKTSFFESIQLTLKRIFQRKTNYNTDVDLKTINSMLIKAFFKKPIRNIDALYKDHLTGLLNNSALSKIVPFVSLLMIRGMALSECTENTEEKKMYTVSVMSLDINSLKFVNDTSGQDEADKGIIEISGILNNILGDSIRTGRSDLIIRGVEKIYSSKANGSILARPHGDEFTIALPGCPKEEAEKIKERINEKIQDRIKDTRGLTIAIGISDTTEIEIPQELKNGEFKKLKGIDRLKFLETFFFKVVNIAEKRMRIDKVENSNPEKAVAALLGRIMTTLGLKEEGSPAVSVQNLKLLVERIPNIVLNNFDVTTEGEPIRQEGKTTSIQHVQQRESTLDIEEGYGGRGR